jgi:catechol 2,3-dioxygenase-like lactoylglutathione lyase family enzyme
MSSPLRNVWVALDHVQLAIPPDSEAACREFYIGVLGLSEVEKPASLAKRGGLWLRTRNLEIHLGVDSDFHPARKAHPAIVATDATAVANHLSEKGIEVTWDENLPDRRRFYIYDNVGNRLEVVQATELEISIGYVPKKDT